MLHSLLVPPFVPGVPSYPLDTERSCALGSGCRPALWVGAFGQGPNQIWGCYLLFFEVELWVWLQTKIISS